MDITFMKINDITILIHWHSFLRYLNIKWMKINEMTQSRRLLSCEQMQSDVSLRFVILFNRLKIQIVLKSDTDLVPNNFLQYYRKM